MLTQAYATDVTKKILPRTRRHFGGSFKTDEEEEKKAASIGRQPVVQCQNARQKRQRPKFEDYGNYIYIVAKMLDYDAKKGEIEIEQLSLIVGPNYVISFQERAGDFFDPLRERIRKGLGRIRKMGTD